MGHQLEAFRGFAHAVRVERAMADGDLAAVHAYDRYAVPYFGEIGRGHSLVTLPSELGQMLAAFTARDAVDAFLAAGSSAQRAAVRFTMVDGEQLFGVVHEVARGVLVNAMGPRRLGLDLEMCRAIARPN